MSELLIIVKIAGERVALAAPHVDSVVEVEAVTPVPRAADHVIGLAALRSRVFTVIDSLAALGLGRAAASAPRQAVVVEADGHLYALLVDRVEDALNYEGKVEPVNSPLIDQWRRVAIGTVELGGDMLLLVDPHALLAAPTAQAA